MQPLHKVLYIEDDPDIQKITSLALQTLGGFEVKVCSSGKEALQQVTAFAPDLLLMDVMMPEMDGPQTLAALRDLPVTATVPAVFMTAKVEAREVAYYQTLGVKGVIAKPFDPMTIVDRLQDIWQQSN